MDFGLTALDLRSYATEPSSSRPLTIQQNYVLACPGTLSKHNVVLDACLIGTVNFKVF
jgi:hypothetical protein